MHGQGGGGGGGMSRMRRAEALALLTEQDNQPEGVWTCTAKRSYPTEIAAQNGLRGWKRKKSERRHLAAYRCPFGNDGHWHIGTRR
jgi:hypothetical protein